MKTILLLFTVLILGSCTKSFVPVLTETKGKRSFIENIEGRKLKVDPKVLDCIQMDVPITPDAKRLWYRPIKTKIYFTE